MNITIEGHPVAVDVVGQGDPILLIHGFPLDRRMWRGQVADLASSWMVIAPDLPGFGESQFSPQISSIDDYADWLAHLLDAVEVSEPVTLCGLSMGGYIAFSFFRRHRHRLSRLILCDTKATSDPPEKQQDRERTAQEVLLNGTAGLVQNMPKALLSATTLQHSPELVTLTQQMIETASPNGVAAASRAMANRQDSTSLLPQIDLPTLVVCGSDDAISPPSEMKAIAESLPQPTFVTIPLAGHLSPFEQFQAFNDTIRNWT